jgi:hypothetical protein
MASNYNITTRVLRASQPTVLRAVNAALLSTSQRALARTGLLSSARTCPLQQCLSRQPAGVCFRIEGTPDVPSRAAFITALGNLETKSLKAESVGSLASSRHVCSAEAQLHHYGT